MNSQQGGPLSFVHDAELPCQPASSADPFTQWVCPASDVPFISGYDLRTAPGSNIVRSSSLPPGRDNYSLARGSTRTSLPRQGGKDSRYLRDTSLHEQTPNRPLQLLFNPSPGVIRKGRPGRTACISPCTMSYGHQPLHTDTPSPNSPDLAGGGKSPHAGPSDQPHRTSGPDVWNNRPTDSLTGPLFLSPL